MSTECLWLRVMKVIHRLHEIFKVAQRFIRVAAQNTCSVPHSDISLCVRERMKPQLDGEYQRGVWNPESNPDCVHTHTHTVCTLAEQSSLLMGSDECAPSHQSSKTHRAHLAAFRPGASSTCSYSTELLTDFFFCSGSIRFSKECSDLPLLCLQVFKSVPSDTGALRLPVSVCAT